jgi:hypothetical protein
MRLQRSAGLAILVAERADHGLDVEALQLADRGSGAEAAGRGGTEEADGAGRRLAHEDRDVDAHRDGGQEVAPVDGAARGRAAFAIGDDRRKDRREGVEHRLLVDAVELERMDLVGVDEGGGRCGQSLAADPDRRVFAASPALRHFDDAVEPVASAPGDGDAERVDEEGLGLVDGVGRQVFVAGRDDPLDEPGQWVCGFLHKQDPFTSTNSGRTKRMARTVSDPR